MKHASTRQVFEYWNSQRGKRAAPDRGDIEPGPIRRALGDTFILSQDVQGEHYFRLAGTRVCALVCRELKDSKFLDLWAKEERRLMHERLAAVVDEGTGFVAGAIGCNREGVAVPIEVLVLPLSHRDRTQIRLLGVLAPLPVPYWIGESAVTDLTCDAVRYLGPETINIRGPRLVPSIEEGRPMDTTMANGRLRRGLWVYDGGRTDPPGAA